MKVEHTGPIVDQLHSTRFVLQVQLVHIVLIRSTALLGLPTSSFGGSAVRPKRVEVEILSADGAQIPHGGDGAGMISGIHGGTAGGRHLLADRSDDGAGGGLLQFEDAIDQLGRGGIACAGLGGGGGGSIGQAAIAKGGKAAGVHVRVLAQVGVGVGGIGGRVVRDGAGADAVAAGAGGGRDAVGDGEPLPRRDERGVRPAGTGGFGGHDTSMICM